VDTIDARPADAERNDEWKKAKLEHGFYNIIDAEKVAASKRLSVINPATGKQLAAVPDVDRALLNKAISTARNAFSRWGAGPFGRRKAILASLLNKIGDHDLWPWMTSHSGIDLITFTKSTNIGKPVLEPAAGTLKLVTLELGGNDSGAVADIDPEKIALFGSIALVPVNCKPGRYGLASTLFEILSFRPVRMRTQVLVWSLARKASYTFPMPRKLSDDF
jgi:Aldehyde dehydrogenase family